MHRSRSTICLLLALSAGVHLALLCLLLAVGRAGTARQVAAPRPPLQLRLSAAPSRRPAPAATAPPATAAAPRTAARRAPMPVVPAPVASAAGAVSVADAAAPPIDELAPIAPAPPNGDDIMRLARRDIAAMAHELNKELAGRDKAFSSRQERLERRFAEAHAAARPDWYSAAKVEELTTPGTGGARVYRITTALGAFCVTYSANGGRPTYGTCP